MKILDQLVGNFKNISVPGPGREGGSILEFAWISIKIILTFSNNIHDMMAVLPRLSNSYTTFLAIVVEVLDERLIIFDIFESNI